MNDAVARLTENGVDDAYSVPRGLKRRLGRGDRSHLAVWFWELDRVLLGLIMVLVAIGLIAVMAASPASADRLSTAETTLSPLYFFYKQIGWVAVGLPWMFVVSMLPKREARRFAILLTAFFLFLLLLVPVVGSTINGAKRWIGYGLTIQPSEFLKPVYAVTLAWILSWKVRDPSLPVVPLSIVLTGLIALLLMRQPDLGQTIMFLGIWFTLMLLTGLSIQIIAFALGAAGFGMIAAYFFYPVATQRINGWLFGSGEYDQVMMANKTLTGGGFIGTGPGLPRGYRAVKRVLRKIEHGRMVKWLHH